MTSEKFCLKWNDFESNVSSSFKDLLAERELFDVTLASGDGQIQAHKVILAACSPFFRAVFRRNPHQHPLLYLKDVRQADLASVIQFIYHGEVNVAQEELNSFLAVAENLQVKGLTQNQEKPDGEPSKLPPPARHRKLEPAGGAGNRLTASHPPAQVEEEVQELLQPVKVEPGAGEAAGHQQAVATYQGEEAGFEEYEDYQQEYSEDYTVAGQPAGQPMDATGAGKLIFSYRKAVLSGG